MAAPDNITKAEDIAYALDVEMNLNFKQEYDRLAEILGIVSPEVVPAGTARYLYKVEGALVDGAVGEGEEVPLSKYTLKKVPIGEHTIRKYRKETTAETILKSGYRNSILRTDEKMMRDLRAIIIEDFFGFLAGGTGKATGPTLQAALAQADATLADTLEKNGDHAGRIVHFVNRFDIADYLAGATVTTQTLFGMTYIKSFLGVEDIFVTSKVPKGTVYVTPTDNLHMYGVDFASLGSAGFGYVAQDGSLIGVHHDVDYRNVSADTHVVSGMDMLAEILDYIVVASIGGAAGTDEPSGQLSEKSVDDMTVDELKVYAAEKNIDITGLTLKADILAAIKAAESGE